METRNTTTCTARLRALGVGEHLDISVGEMKPSVVRGTCTYLRDYGFLYRTNRVHRESGEVFTRVIRLK